MDTLIKNLNYILINSYSRSGSTILEKLILQNFNAIGIGELKHIWERGFIQNLNCSCGVEIQKCSFWSKVYNFYKENNIDWNQIENLRLNLDRNRFYIFFEVMKFKNTKYNLKKEKYRKELIRLIELIIQYSGKTLIIDSSKDPAHAGFLNKIFSIKNIFLLRESRGVINSYKKNIHYDKANGIKFDKKISVRTFIEWFIINLLIIFSSRNYFFIEYKNISNNLDNLITNLDLDNYKTNNNFSYHSISGNPVRFEKKFIFDQRGISKKQNSFYDHILNFFDYIIKKAAKKNCINKTL